MKTLEDYKDALERAGPHPAELLLAEAESDGLTAWQIAELVGFRGELWA